MLIVTSNSSIERESIEINMYRNYFLALSVPLYLQLLVTPIIMVIVYGRGY
jgi:hypothetical protein